MRYWCSDVYIIIHLGKAVEFMYIKLILAVKPGCTNPGCLVACVK
jgi:hypothetical protein